MSMIGLRKKREKKIERINNSPQWVWVGPPEEENDDVPKIDMTEYSEEQVRAACEWTLFFMLLHRPPIHEDQWPWWYEMVTTEAARHPSGSYRNCFFWGLRFFNPTKHGKDYAMEDFRGYLDWKIDQFNQGFIKRTGPIW
jgi:hypothetical protein